MLKTAMILLIITATSGCRTPSFDTKSDLLITGGVTKHYHESVAALLNYQGRRFCSATMVSNTVALTAAHCVELAEEFLVVSQNKIRIPSRIYVPNEYFRRPYDTKYHHDIAALIFEDNKTHSFVRARLHTKLQPEKDKLEFYGYGCNRAIQYRINNYPHLKRAYDSGLLQWSTPHGVYIARHELEQSDGANSYVVKGVGPHHEIEVEGCRGDSGGALMDENALVGVTSRQSESGSEAATFFVALQSYKTSNFVNQVLSGNSPDDSRTIEVAMPHWHYTEDQFQSNLDSIKANLEYISENQSQISNEIERIYQGLELEQSGDDEFI